MKDPDESAYILVVEDNCVNRLLLTNSLRRLDFRKVDIAQSGATALELTARQNYDVILMDIQMPLMDGYELTRIIRSSGNGSSKRIPIIAITAHASENEKRKAMEAGMDDFIMKPYTIDELARVMEKYLAVNKNHFTHAASTASAAETVTINYEHLEHYSGGDKQLQAKLIEIFLKQVPECIEEIEKALPANDWPIIYRAAHKIKSSITVFKLEELRILTLTLEEYAREQTFLHKIPELFNCFKEGCIPVINQLESDLESIQTQLNSKKS